jgi:L-lactate utilization protein LutC
MSGNGGAILARVRRALATARLPRPAGIPDAVTPTFEDPLGAFRSSLEALGGRVLTPTAREAIDTVVELVSAAEGDAIAWAPEELPLSGLDVALRAAGVQIALAELPGEAGARAARLAQLARAAVGLTGAVAGVAETGSLVLTSGPGRPRLAWLLPPRHVALLPRARILPTLEVVLAAHPGLCEASAEVAFVSGPSRSADIELTLTRGVHGPRELDVVVLP